MLYEHLGKRPKIDPSSRVAPNAVLCGEVTVGPNCSIGFGAVLSAESGPITIGANCVVMDTAVVRGVRNNPVAIGDNVLVGPRAYLSGCTVGDAAFLATGATVFNGARVGARAEVRINAVVHLRTVLPPGAVVPISWIAVGDPAEVLPPEAHERIWAIQKPLDFPGYVFGVER
ncbi:MAG: gamma carbonic anhydrase family protein, partial [Kiloniellaceae bacterium]